MSYRFFQEENFYNLCGLVNAHIETAQIPFKQGIRLRIALQIGANKQAILEVDNLSRYSIPKMSPNFKSPIQLVIIRNCLFIGEKTVLGRMYYHFKVHDTARRYIWISSQRKDFWEAPRDCTSEQLVLEKSPGSIFGKSVLAVDKEIKLSQLIDGRSWQEWVREANLMEETFAITARVVDNPSEMPMHM